MEQKEHQTLENDDKQVVLSNPPCKSSDYAGKENIPIPIPIPIPEPKPKPEPVSEPNPRQCGPSVSRSVGAYTVQCAMCDKWRLIPSKGKYQEIREHIIEEPFTCDLAREWRSEVSCDDPGDIEQDGSRLWAVDNPNISKPPPGWDRELRIRGIEGRHNFADVYYISPTGKRLRSIVQVQRYLMEHPKFITQGVTLSKFSFKTLKPLQKNCIRKYIARPNETVQDDHRALQLDKHVTTVTPPVKKKPRSSLKHTVRNDSLDNQPQRYVNVKGSFPPPNGL